MRYTEKEALEIIRHGHSSEDRALRLHSYYMWLSEDSIKIIQKEICELDEKEDQLFEEYKYQE
jgi:hypothetical protein